MSRWNSNEKSETVYAANFRIIKTHMEEKKLIMGIISSSEIIVDRKLMFLLFLFLVF
jgi:hypothetical protein